MTEKLKKGKKFWYDPTKWGGNNFKHGMSKKYPHLYSLWTTMLHRCENPKREKYKDYGARGITVCKEWPDVKKFIKWAFDNGYKEGLQIDRIDNNGNYEPSNCRWITPKQNASLNGVNQ